METTTVKVVYTPVNSSVDNSVTCGMYFWITQVEASNSLKTTPVKDVYTTVCKSVDNHWGCVEDISHSQAVYRLFTDIGELSPVIHRVVNNYFLITKSGYFSRAT